MISHVLEGGGSYFRTSELGKIDGVMRPGSTAVALPGSIAEGRNPSAQLLGLAISQNRIETELANVGGVDRLHAAASQLIDDALIATVLRSLWTDAEDHGASSAFFDHGVGLILRSWRRCAQTK